MFSRKLSLWLILLAVLLAGVGASAQTARRDRRTQNAVTRNPPTVAISSDINTITLCPRDAALATSQVRLKADAKSPDGNPLRYTWTVSGGRLVGDGANPTWDLSGVGPGIYTAQVDVASSPDPDCTAFATTAVRVVECPPLREFCPNISISCPDTTALGSTVTFTADVSGGTPGITPIYAWTISAGRIISGQGTNSITVDNTGLGGQDIKATIEVGGYGRVCSATCTTQIPAPPVIRLPFDQFPDIQRNDEKARLDNFAIQLQGEPDARGYIIVYGGGNSKAARDRAIRMRGYLVNTRNLDSSRIVTLIGNPRGDLKIELWIVPAGAEPPTVRQ